LTGEKELWSSGVVGCASVATLLLRAHKLGVIVTTLPVLPLLVEPEVGSFFAET
jgi:hypothetical protein